MYLSLYKKTTLNRKASYFIHISFSTIFCSVRWPTKPFFCLKLTFILSLGFCKVQQQKEKGISRKIFHVLFPQNIDLYIFLTVRFLVPFLSRLYFVLKTQYLLKSSFVKLRKDPPIVTVTYHIYIYISLSTSNIYFVYIHQYVRIFHGLCSTREYIKFRQEK